jgi:hypothetical protein
MQDPIHRTCGIVWLVRWRAAQLSNDGDVIWSERGQCREWSQRWRASGSAAAKQMGGWRQLRLKREREWLLARIVEKPDLAGGGG